MNDMTPTGLFRRVRRLRYSLPHARRAHRTGCPTSVAGRRMNYLLWSLPMLVIAGAIAIARLNATQAALGLLATVPVAIYAGDTASAARSWPWRWNAAPGSAPPSRPTSWADCCSGKRPRTAPARSDGGAASPADAATGVACCSSPVSWSAFAEAATGFGVGMRHRRVAARPAHRATPPDGLRAVEPDADPLGAMSSGTLLASAYARMTGTELALYAMVPTAALMALVWLPLYWRTASRAGFDPHSGGKTGAPARGRLDRGRAGPARRVHRLARPRDRAAGRLRPADHAALSARPPPDRRAFAATARRMLPYAALIGAALRLVPEWRAALAAVGRVAPTPICRPGRRCCTPAPG